MIVTALLEQPCNKSNNINKVVARGQQLVTILMALSDLLQGCSNKSDAVMT